MKKIGFALMVFVGLGIQAGQVSLPEERLALPEVQGNHLICIWDEAGQSWYTDFESYNHSGSMSFQLPEWGKWYWVGLWDEAVGEYVFGKWVGHFVSG